MEFFAASLLLGAVAGLSAGLFGIGGGMIIVPVLAWLLAKQQVADNLVMIMAIATSLATIIFTAISAIVAHHRRGNVLWHRVFSLSPGIVIGVVAGSVIAESIDATVLRVIFALFLLYVAAQMALQLKPTVKKAAESRLVDSLVGIIIGVAAAILGIGGGTLTVPYLVSRQVAMKNAVAVSSACGLPIAIVATVSYAWLGLKHVTLPELSFGYVYVPAFLGISLSSVFTAPVGAKLAHNLPAEKLKRYFSIVLVVMAVKMLW